MEKWLEMPAETTDRNNDDQTLRGRFGQCLKFCLSGDLVGGVKVAELWRLSISTSSAEQINFKQYVDLMKKDQNGIFRVTRARLGAPQGCRLRSWRLRKQGLGGSYMVEPIDGFAVQLPKGFAGKQMQPTTKERHEQADDDEKKLEQPKAEFEP